MIALIILGIIALIVILIMLVPVGADIAYEGGQLRVSAKVAGMLLQLFPRPPKDTSKPAEEKKPPQEKKTEKKSEKAPKKKLELDFSFDEIMELLKKVLKGFGILGRKFRVDRFLLDYLAAGRDPYITSRIFGYVNAGLNILAPICAQRFDCKELYVRTDVDFEAEEMKLDFGIALTIRIGAIFRMINTILFGALGILIRHKLKKTKEKLMRRIKGESETDDQPETETEEIEINIQQEERNDENGK